MAEENFIQRLVGEFKTGVDAIHGLCIESRRSAVRRQNPRKTSIADVPSSTRSPFYSLPTNSELFARFRPSFGEMPHPENHSRQQTRACPSSELRRITPKAPSLPYRRLRSRFTGDQGLKVVKSDFTELDDKTKPVDERTSSPARSSDEPFSSPSTTNASQDWETETLCSSCFSHAYASNDCESPTHQLKPITETRNGENQRIMIISHALWTNQEISIVQNLYRI